jgi:hypothetical protein
MMMTINHNSLGTSADGADIFVISKPTDSFSNFASLTTSGNLARAMRVAANGVTVRNHGDITTHGDGSSGIIVGEAFGDHYDHATVTNFGTITTTGFTFDDGSGPIFAAGIDLFGNHNVGINHGTITNLDGDDAGMNSIGSDSTLINFGTIDSNIVGMVIDTITGDEAHSSAVNRGSIVTHWDGSYGMAALIGDNSLENDGTIEINGVQSFGMALNGDRVHGENHGTILGNGEADRGVLLEAVSPTLDNYGTIRTTAADSIGVRFGGEELPGSDGGTFTNYGKVISAAWSVKGALADDHVINRGSLSGDVYMGAGDDTFVAGRGGSLAGTLTLADGNDLIIFEKGGGNLVVTDFSAGAGTDDVIDLGAFSYASFAELMAHATQSGTDVVLKLGAKDQILLRNVALQALAPDDFVLSGSGVHGHASLHHDLVGMI